jgi:serine/threonine-protein kinase
VSAAETLDVLRDALRGRYAVKRLIATGGMGSVFLGRDITLERPVAIKVIVPELAASRAVPARGADGGAAAASEHRVCVHRR